SRSASPARAAPAKNPGGTRSRKPSTNAGAGRDPSAPVIRSSHLDASWRPRTATSLTDICNTRSNLMLTVLALRPRVSPPAGGETRGRSARTVNMRLERVLQMSVNEVAVRGRQEASKWLDRMTGADGSRPAPAFVDGFRERVPPGFFAGAARAGDALRL